MWFVDMLSWMNKLGSIYVYVYLNQHEINFTKAVYLKHCQ